MQVQHSVVLPKLFTHDFLHVQWKHENGNYVVLAEFPLIGFYKDQNAVLTHEQARPCEERVEKQRQNH